MNQQESVLVTGGCGYIGSHVTRMLSEQGYRVVVYDNLSTGFRSSLIHNEALIVADLADINALDRTFSEYNVRHVLHFAASIVVPESVEKPLLYYRNNTVNTINLLDVCAKHKVRSVMFSSTAAVYGETTQAMVDENTPTQPSNPYARSKLMDEEILRDVNIAFPDLHFVILRYFNVAGADPLARIGQRSPNATHLIKVACETALGKREKMLLYGSDYPTRDGTCIRDYIHIEDLASAHLLALRYLMDRGESVTLNCGYGHGYTVKEVLKTTGEVHGTPIPHDIVGRRQGDVSALVADSRKLAKLFNWVPQYADLRKIVSSAYEWEKKVQKGLL